MHPVDKKSILYIVLVTAITAPIMIYSWLDSYLFVFVTIFLFGIHGAFTKKYLHAAILTSFFTAYICLIFFLFKYLLFANYWEIYAFLVSFLAAISIPATSYKPVVNFYTSIVKAARNEKNIYFAIQKFPNVLCREHNVRTNMITHLGYQKIRCRNGENCSTEAQLACAKYIVGTIGGNGEFVNSDDNYYVAVWNNRNKTVLNADYDVIEIHESNTVEDYNSVIDKVVNFLYNEIERYKPINEILVRIVGKPDISESTKRLLNDRFMKVKYLTQSKFEWKKNSIII